MNDSPSILSAGTKRSRRTQVMCWTVTVGANSTPLAGMAHALVGTRERSNRDAHALLCAPSRTGALPVSLLHRPLSRLTQTR
jgi:hypothetical protein